MLSFLNSHKTKIVGFLLVVAGAVQANSSVIQSLVTPRQFALGTVVVGVVVAALGFLNSNSSSAS